MFKRTVSLRRLFRVPVTYFLLEKYKNHFKLLTLIRRPDSIIALLSRLSTGFVQASMSKIQGLFKEF